MKKTITGVVLVMIASVCWGVISLFSIPLGEMGFTSMDKAFVRSIISVLVMGLIMLFKDRKLFKIRLRDLPVFVLMGGAGLLLTMFCYMLSIEYNGSSLSATLMYTSSVWVVIFCALFFKERITLKKVVCLCGVIGGCAIFAFGGDIKISFVGIAVGLLTGLCYSCYSIGSKMAKKRYSSLTAVFYAFVFATLFSMPFVNYKIFATSFSTNKMSLLYCVLIALVCTTVPYFIYTISLNFLSAGTASILATSDMIFATVVGLVFFPKLNTLGVLGFAGLIIVFGFLVLIEIPIEKLLVKKNKE